jgi:hypothetical protein
LNASGTCAPGVLKDLDEYIFEPVGEEAIGFSKDIRAH